LLSREELEQIPLRYRLLVKAFLKLPNPGIPFFIMRHFPEFEGILWGLVVPLSLGFFIWFDMWFVAFLSLHFSFPLNVIIGFLVPAIPFLFFLRIELERTILWWRNIHEQPKEWQISKKVDELIDLFNRQQKGKKS
jgi:hypothetical protein